MKMLLLPSLLLTLLFGCTTKKTSTSTNNTAAIPQSTIDSLPNFFPVTTYIKGEIRNIKEGAITPIKRIIINGKTDSTFLKMEEVDAALADFTSPIIDTANLKTTFVEKKFLDQTLNAFTFTYDPLQTTTNNFAFTHWDVYVDPETEKIKRIYLVKKIADTVILQLTWNSGKNCKIVYLQTNDYKTTVTKEVTISWTY